MTTYEFRSGLGFKMSEVDPQSVGEALESIRESGPVNAERVVETARDEESALHGAFEWDDSIAAHEHRLGQARSLIRSVKIVHEPGQPSSPAYYRVVENNESRYELAEVVVRDADLYESALEQLNAELRSAERSVRELERAAAQQGNRKRAQRAARIRKPLEQAIGAAAN